MQRQATAGPRHVAGPQVPMYASAVGGMVPQSHLLPYRLPGVPLRPTYAPQVHRHLPAIKAVPMRPLPTLLPG